MYETYHGTISSVNQRFGIGVIRFDETITVTRRHFEGDISVFTDSVEFDYSQFPNFKRGDRIACQLRVGKRGNIRVIGIQKV